MPLPPLFLERLKEIVPQNIEESFLNKKKPYIRTNLLLTDKTYAHLQNLPREEITAHPDYQKGYFYLQNPSSILTSKVLDPRPGETILDMCAAPGSKTTHIACLMNKTGELIANEKNKSRFFKLLSVLKHQHADDFVKTIQFPGQTLPKKYTNFFDRVLVDAPCSGEARFLSDDPNTYKFWSHKKIKDMARKQKQLLYAAIQCTKSGGTIIYSTCTFAPEENEGIITHVLKKFKERISILPIETSLPPTYPCLTSFREKKFHPDVSKAIRILPTDTHSAFFICKIQKNT